MTSRSSTARWAVHWVAQRTLLWRCGLPRPTPCPACPPQYWSTAVLYQWTPSPRSSQALLEDGYPELRIMLCIGGVDPKQNYELLRQGVHMAVATPGRLKDFLHKKRMNLDICRWEGSERARKSLSRSFL